MAAEAVEGTGAMVEAAPREADTCTSYPLGYMTGPLAKASSPSI